MAKNFRLLVLASTLVVAAYGAIMNGGGVPYSISNPPGSTKDWKGTPGTYSTDFTQNVKGLVEHFDVYGEVQTKYSQALIPHFPRSSISATSRHRHDRTFTFPPKT